MADAWACCSWADARSDGWARGSWADSGSWADTWDDGDRKDDEEKNNTRKKRRKKKRKRVSVLPSGADAANGDDKDDEESGHNGEATCPAPAESVPSDPKVKEERIERPAGQTNAERIKETKRLRQAFNRTIPGKCKDERVSQPGSRAATLEYMPSEIALEVADPDRFKHWFEIWKDPTKGDKSWAKCLQFVIESTISESESEDG